MQVVTVTAKPLEVRMQGPQGQERLKIRGEYPNTPLSQSLFTNLGLMHLIAPYLPREITTDFPVAKEIRDLIRAMYKHEGAKPPRFQSPRKELDFSSPKTQSKKVAVAYSAGKDSLWNMWWSTEKYGNDNVLCTHIAGLNRNNAPCEKRYSEKQATDLEFRNFELIDLLNSSKNTGYPVMRSRDMFLSGVVAPIAIDFGASKIITEGFRAGAHSENKYVPFTDNEENMEYFNEILHLLGIPVEVVWRNKHEMDIVKDLILNKPDWLASVHNCFCIEPYKISHRGYWAEKAKTFPLYDSQCGSCVKCRITNIARILYDPQMEDTTVKDIQAYLKNTIEWIKRSGSTHLIDMIEGSFVRDVKRACKRYDIEIPEDIKAIPDGKSN